MWRILHHELAEENYILLKFLMQFLNEVGVHVLPKLINVCEMIFRFIFCSQFGLTIFVINKY